MPQFNNMSVAQRPELHIFYVLDTSGSMRGTPINVLNAAMDSTIDAVRQVAMANANAKVKVAAMEFNSNVRWVQPNGPEDLDDFFWDPLTASGNTYVGMALKELDSKLRPEAYLRSPTGALLPVIIFMTDGYAVDDYESALNKIRQNKWFSRATRIGFAIGKKPDVEMISKLAGSSEAVIRTDDLGVFANMMRFVSVTSSMLQSQGRPTDNVNRGAEAVRNAAQIGGYDVDQFTPNVSFEEDYIPDSAWDPNGNGVYVNPGDYGVNY